MKITIKLWNLPIRKIPTVFCHINFNRVILNFVWWNPFLVSDTSCSAYTAAHALITPQENLNMQCMSRFIGYSYLNKEFFTYRSQLYILQYIYNRSVVPDKHYTIQLLQCKEYLGTFHHDVPKGKLRFKRMYNRYVVAKLSLMQQNHDHQQQICFYLVDQ